MAPQKAGNIFASLLLLVIYNKTNMLAGAGAEEQDQKQQQELEVESGLTLTLALGPLSLGD